MTKSELIEALARETDVSLRTAEAVMNTILDTMTDALVRGESIELRGMGSFTVKKYDSYKGRNPNNGEIVQVKPKKLPLFRPGKDLRERVNAARKGD